MIRFSVIVALWLGVASAAAADQFAVPLLVHELLPLSAPGSSTLVPGLTRTQEAVTSGIPLPDSYEVSDPAVLAVLDSSGAPIPAQFRILKRHPSGNVQWLLVDFRADVSAGSNSTYTLTPGTNPGQGLSPLAQDGGTSIVVNTGPAQFGIRKANFDGFNWVVVDGRLLVDGARPRQGFVMRDQADALYSSTNDPASTALIEENGPLRAVVKARGSFKNSAGTRLMDYTVRLHFYRDRSQVKAFLTLRNAAFTTVKNPPHTQFNSAEFEVPLEITQGMFTFPRMTDVLAESLATSDNAYLYQAFTTKYLGAHSWNCMGQRIPPMAYQCPTKSSPVVYLEKGLEVRKNGVVLNALGNAAEHAGGWADLSGSDGVGLTIGVRWMAGLWPSGFDLQGDGRMSVELFSKRNAQKALPFTWGAHETREVIFDFHAGAAGGAAALWQLQYPLMARPPYALFGEAAAVFGETMLSTQAEQQAWFDERRALVVTDNAARIFVDDPAFDAERFYRWEEPDEQHDHPLARLLEFYRTGRSGLYLDADNRVQYNADSAVRHSDGFDFSTARRTPPGKGINGWPFDRAHPHWLSILVMYHLRGDERLKDAVLDLGEFKDGDRYGALPGFGSNWRTFVRTWRDFALLYDATCELAACNERYWNYVAAMSDTYLDSRDDPDDVTVWGRNLERGYFYAWKHPSIRSASQNLYSRIHPEAQFEVLRVLRRFGDRYPRTDELEDALEGHGLFAYHEPYYQRAPVPNTGEYGYLADKSLKGNYRLDIAHTPSSHLTMQDGCQLMRFMYERTGDPKYLVRGSMLLFGAARGEADQAPAPQCQAMIYQDRHRDDGPAGGWLEIAPVTVTDLGGGSYRLSWTVPADAAKYRIKYATKTIVEWLGFDQFTRTYAFSPDQYIAFYGAPAVATPPAPGAPGTTQEFVVNGLDPAHSWQFAVRFLLVD